MKQLKVQSSFFCLFSFTNFTFDFNGFHLEKLKISQYGFEKARERKLVLVGNNKDNRVLNTTY